MERNFKTEQLEKARNADLYEFLIQTEPFNWETEGSSIRMYDPIERTHKNIVVTENSNRFSDYDSGKYGDSISFLTDYRDYTFQDAVIALSDPCIPVVTGAKDTVKEPQEEYPQKSYTSRRLYAYLCNRGIPSGTVAELIKRGILYQTDNYYNAVFINPEKTFAEICGTNSNAKKNYRKLIEKDKESFWYFSSGRTEPEKAYICESAIDAVSLREFLRIENGDDENAYFCAIYDPGRQEKIDIIKSCLPIVFALKQTEDAKECLKKNEGCQSITPTRENWNEELVKGRVQ